MADFGFASQDSFITLLTPARPGDYNTDGTVDGADYAFWRAEFGAFGDHATDGNGDHVVDAADYVVWRRFATATGSGVSSAASVQVPESASLVLVSICGSLIFVASRRSTVRSRLCVYSIFFIQPWRND
jgi:hypothetical protein